MPPTDANPAVGARQTCPLCHTPLPEDNPTSCPKCDWHLGYRRQREQPVGTVRDWSAVCLSVVPGLGHFYKGHRLLAVILLLGSVLATFGCVVAATASAGWGLLLLPLYWIGVMTHVFLVEDLHPAPQPKG